MMQTIRRLRPYASPYRRALAVGGVLTLAEVGAQPGPALAAALGGGQGAAARRSRPRTRS